MTNRGSIFVLAAAAVDSLAMLVIAAAGDFHDLLLGLAPVRRSC
jgi:hypothetical protein